MPIFNTCNTKFVTIWSNLVLIVTVWSSLTQLHSGCQWPFHIFKQEAVNRELCQSAKHSTTLLLQSRKCDYQKVLMVFRITKEEGSSSKFTHSTQSGPGFSRGHQHPLAGAVQQLQRGSPPPSTPTPCPGGREKRPSTCWRSLMSTAIQAAPEEPSERWADSGGKDGLVRTPPPSRSHPRAALPWSPSGPADVLRPVAGQTDRLTLARVGGTLSPLWWNHCCTVSILIKDSDTSWNSISPAVMKGIITAVVLGGAAALPQRYLLQVLGHLIRNGGGAGEGWGGVPVHLHDGFKVNKEVWLATRG